MSVLNIRSEVGLTLDTGCDLDIDFESKLHMNLQASSNILCVLLVQIEWSLGSCKISHRFSRIIGSIFGVCSFCGSACVTAYVLAGVECIQSIQSLPWRRHGSGSCEDGRELVK